MWQQRNPLAARSVVNAARPTLNTNSWRVIRGFITKTRIRLPRFTCQVCGKSFHQAYCLRKHLVVHSKEKLHKCDVCGKSFHFRNNLLRHQRFHTAQGNARGTKQTPLFCMWDDLGLLKRPKNASPDSWGTVAGQLYSVQRDPQFHQHLEISPTQTLCD